MEKMIILGIETSCDDTSVCLLESRGPNSKVLSLENFSHDKLLANWQGVVPEVVARNHSLKLPPLIQSAFSRAPEKLRLSDIDLIAVTTHPGLLGPLLTGLSAAKTLSMLTRKPVVPVNHLYAHLEAIHLSHPVSYPYLGLLVSGGHTLFLLAKSPLEFELIGTTLDDAAGEAFDKGGKLLGLGYPAGPAIDKLARGVEPDERLFPVALKGREDANLSFSGVKTALKLYLAQSEKAPLAKICASYQHAIVEALRIKTGVALKIVRQRLSSTPPLVVGGGVACNSYLRAKLADAAPSVLFVGPRFCTDNAAMIANYAARSWRQNALEYPRSLDIDAKGRFLSRKRLLEEARKRKRL